MLRSFPEQIIAKEKGELYFKTSKPCKKGHLSLRYTSCGICVECNKENSKTDKVKETNRAYYQRNKQKRISHSKKWKADNPEKVKGYRVAYYGLTLDEYNELLEKQDYKCIICKCELDQGKHTHVDHCHITNKVRGILCTNCNKALGCFKDCIETMQSAIDYLKGFL